jgi:hypothetical protein
MFTRNPMEEVQHGPLAGYNSDGNKYCPFIDCVCGWEGGRQDSFEIAGQEFDEHVLEAKTTI